MPPENQRDVRILNAEEKKIVQERISYLQDVVNSVRIININSQGVQKVQTALDNATQHLNDNQFNQNNLENIIFNGRAETNLSLTLSKLIPGSEEKKELAMQRLNLQEENRKNPPQDLQEFDFSQLQSISAEQSLLDKTCALYAQSNGVENPTLLAKTRQEVQSKLDEIKIRIDASDNLDIKDELLNATPTNDHGFEGWQFLQEECNNGKNIVVLQGLLKRVNDFSEQYVDKKLIEDRTYENVPLIPEGTLTQPSTPTSGENDLYTDVGQRSPKSRSPSTSEEYKPVYEKAPTLPSNYNKQVAKLSALQKMAEAHFANGNDDAAEQVRKEMTRLQQEMFDNPQQQGQSDESAANPVVEQNQTLNAFIKANKTELKPGTQSDQPNESIYGDASATPMRNANNVAKNSDNDAYLDQRVSPTQDSGYGSEIEDSTHMNPNQFVNKAMQNSNDVGNPYSIVDLCPFKQETEDNSKPKKPGLFNKALGKLGIGKSDKSPSPPSGSKSSPTERSV